jgi:hypothetical protein
MLGSDAVSDASEQRFDLICSLRGIEEVNRLFTSKRGRWTSQPLRGLLLRPEGFLCSGEDTSRPDQTIGLFRCQSAYFAPVAEGFPRNDQHVNLGEGHAAAADDVLHGLDRKSAPNSTNEIATAIDGGPNCAVAANDL